MKNKIILRNEKSVDKGEYFSLHNLLSSWSFRILDFH